MRKLLTAGLFACLCVSGFAAPVELLKNGGFEVLDQKGKAKGAWVNGVGASTVVDDAHSGQHAAKFEGGGGYGALVVGSVPLDTSATYRVSVWAKGSGSLSINIYQYSHSTALFLGTKFLPAVTLTQEWKKYEFTYQPDNNPNILRGNVALSLSGKGPAWFDDASFTIDPDENPGVALAEKAPTTTLKFRIQTRDANARLFANEQEIALKNGEGQLEVTEGLVAVAVRVEATGVNPGIRVRLADHPETDNRWRTGPAEAPGWMGAAFDDSAWPAAGQPADGFQWSGEKTGKGQVVLFRQVILWNATHYGPQRCLTPKMKKWGFSEGSMETFHLALYSPIPLRMDADFDFVLDLPKEFRLMDVMNYTPRGDVRPRKVSLEPIRRDDREYTRYVISLGGAARIAPMQTGQQFTWLPLPVQMERKPDLKEYRFYYRRAGRGNFTELEQSVPIEVLPPINGRMPRDVRISVYGGGYNGSWECTTAYYRQATQTGINQFVLCPVPWWGPSTREVQKLNRELILQNGGKFTLWAPFNFPLNYGISFEGALPNYAPWLKQHPEAHGRYIYDAPWGNPSNPYGMPYDEQYVLDEGREFWPAVEKDYRWLMDYLPGASMLFLDWEHPVLTGAPDAKGSAGFSDRAKKAFRQYAKLSDTEDLSDTTIVARYRDKWTAFRHQQDGRIIGKTQEICRKLGLPLLFYAQTGDGIWSECKGRVDIAFPGFPGNAFADSFYQKNLDSGYQTFRALGWKHVVGQRFAYDCSWGDPTVDENASIEIVYSRDGFVDAPSWKTQVLRITAALHGGLDLDNTAVKHCGGTLFYVGEATRLISTYERLFYDGERADDLVESADIKYPDALVLKLDKERLVLLFNEGKAPKTVSIRNKDLRPGQTAQIYETDQIVKNPAQMQVTIPARDVMAVHIR